MGSRSSPRRARSINGTVVSDTGEPFDFRAPQLQIGSRPGSPDIQAMGAGAGMASARVGDDWSFTLRNVIDAVIVRAQPPQGWAMKSVFVNGQEITDTPTEFPAGQTVSGMQIVLTKKITSLTGQVTRLEGQPGARRDRRGVPGRREAVDLPVALHQGGASRSGGQISRDGASRSRTAIWWSRCRVSRTARPAIPSSSRRSRISPRNSSSARANRRRLTLNCLCQKHSDDDC